MSHEVESAAYARTPAWHRLGTVFAGDAMTTAEAMELGGLDWTVELRPIYIVDGWRHVTVPDKHAVVRTSDNKPLGVVGNRYHPIQPVEAFNFIDAVVDSGAAKIDTVGSLAGGKRTFMVAKTTREILVGGEPTEKIAPYLFFRNSYDGTSAVQLLLTKIRVVCANTENMALSTARSSYSIRHTANWNTKVREAREVLDISFAHDEEFERLANELITQPFTHGLELDRFLGRLLPRPAGAGKTTERIIQNRKEQRDAIKTILLTEPNLANINKTRWGALNAVTQWADWSRPVKANGENRLNRILEDTSVKTRAFELLSA